MWKLKNTKIEHWEHFVFVGNECVVGRKDAGLLIANDPSVSRKHAVLFVMHREENLGYPSKKSSIFLRDEGSKYGTFKNGVKINKEEELDDGDVIKFGQFESEFRISYIPLVVTTSCLDVASKNKLKKSIHLLGGHLVSEWQPACNYLVMSEVKVTIKALCCLVSLKSIVIPEYFEELEKKLKSTATIVPPNEFIPPIGESLIDKDKVSFDVNPIRKNLFKDKKFFFMDEKQFKKLHLGIIMGGGKASILTEENADIESIVNDNSCFIEPVKCQVKDETREFLTKIISALQKKSLRTIPESDIGLAVAYASTETFCNPCFNVGSAVLGSQKIPSQTLSEREVYVPDTQRSLRPTSSKRTSLLNLGNQPKVKKQKLEAPDSLNLTSFRTDEAEEIFEVPLSAQVKQELDDIYEVTMKAVYADPDNEVEKLPETLPLQPEVEVNPINEPSRKEVTIPEGAPPKRQLKVELNTSVQNENRIECVSPPQKRPKVELNTSLPNGNRNRNRIETVTTSPKKPKIERNISVVNGNDFDLVTVNGDTEKNLPRNLIKIEYAALVVRVPRSAVGQTNVNLNTKNFKKFKKVYPKKAQVLPTIIGGRDLVPYDKDASKLTENWNNDEVKVKKNKPVSKGAFDWASQED